jgi:hypothetical protein
LLFLLLPARRASFLRPVSSELLEIAKIKLGPPLNGIDGRKSGTFEGFNYSPANKSSGITFLAGGLSIMGWRSAFLPGA